MDILEDEVIDDLQINGLHIIQKKNGFKFGVDAVLLSDFAKDTLSKRTMDLCTGTGIVPLLLSAKTKTPDIYAVEIQPNICSMAQRSVIYNSLEDRIHIDNIDLKKAPEKYGRSSFDKITCNPPYIKSGCAIINELDTKTISRHEVMCTLEDVISVSAMLLEPKGHFFMIHRPSRLVDIVYLMKKYSLEPKRMRFVHSYPNAVPNLLLIEGIARGGSELKLMPPLYIYNDDGTYSQEINKIYGRI